MGIPVLIIGISIHSLVKRETKPVIVLCALSTHFNPLPRKEGGLTPSWCSATTKRGDFNPLPRKEGDGVFPAGFFRLVWCPFQSTPS